MKIANIRTLKVEIPLDKPMITAIHRTDTVGCVLISIETECGLVGENYIFALNKARLDVFEGMIKSLTPHVIGQNPLYVERIWENMWADINPVGHKGIAVSAISAIDTALWDLIGKKAQLPLYQLFGACRDSVKAYASSGLWLSSSIDELVDEAQDFVRQGFRSVKLRLGKENPAEDVARVAALREALGDDIEILTDANQALTPRQAIRLAGQIEKYNIGWFEEPVSANDLVGHARILRASNIPVASGETDYTRFGMKNILDAHAVDVLMPDLQRIGGLSEFRKSVALASAYHVPVSTHIFTEQSLSIAGSAANCISVEHVSWFSPLYQEKMVLVEGEIPMPQAPGLGFNFDYDFIDQHLMR
ncbi:mandelate racemase/muconate lactonizing enzyme family protein [uncultured Oceanisphaera sp.]|uniref:mandelate racemase/muconate lactonizing enzyme family protein n=1 Tax=uncultured Oceanisphaera sp. TaxID=353858 RepID=UPI0026210025|nr:mandelate racemase/muconate lactonizing enzyme family protein [uncultured Oceanisphaera sp.]